MWAWFALAVLALIGELSTGTFYLLLLAIGLAVGGLCALLGLSLHWQLIACIVMALVSLVILRKSGLMGRHRRLPKPDALSLDIGQPVQVTQWSENQTTSVWYRGATWQARLQSGHSPVPGAYVIVAIDGAQLLIKPLDRQA